MQIYFHSCLCSYLPRVPILMEDTVCVMIDMLLYVLIAQHHFTLSNSLCHKALKNAAT